MADCFPREAAEVLEKAFLPQYERTLAFFYSELVQLNTTLFILDSVVAFPFHLFGDGNGDIFYYMTVLNGMEVATSIIHRLLLDNEPKAYSLVRFKNDIATSIKEKYREEFRTHLKKAKIEKTKAGLLLKADRIRNDQVAHLSRALASGQAKVAKLGLKELNSIKDTLNRIYSSLCFNTQSLFLPIPYASNVIHPVGSDSRPDVVRGLDQLAFDSQLIRMPESNAMAWRELKKRYSAKDVAIINSYRRRKGLSEA